MRPALVFVKIRIGDPGYLEQTGHFPSTHTAYEIHLVNTRDRYQQTRLGDLGLTQHRWTSPVTLDNRHVQVALHVFKAFGIEVNDDYIVLLTG